MKVLQKVIMEWITLTEQQQIAESFKLMKKYNYRKVDINSLNCKDCMNFEAPNFCRGIWGYEITIEPGMCDMFNGEPEIHGIE